jgi:hypothetical protein
MRRSSDAPQPGAFAAEGRPRRKTARGIDEQTATGKGMRENACVNAPTGRRRLKTADGRRRVSVI